MNSSNNAVIYPRFSSHGQNEQSIEGQIRICREFAESKGFNVVKIYPEKAKTGTNDNRPAFQQMIKDAATKTFQHIIVYKFDRFARSRRDSIMYKELLKEKYGIKVLSALEPITDDEGGEFYEMFLEWNDEKYSKRLSKRVRDGLDTSVANGLFCGGFLIYGYKIHKEPITGKNDRYIKTVVIDEEQAETVRYVFTEYVKGTEKKDIAAALNAQGKKYNGKPFKGRTFDKWLSYEKYTGAFTFGGRECDNMYPAIIDKALFLKAQERLKRNKYFSGSNSAREPYLLTGKLYCGHCGEPMISGGGTSHTGATYYYYDCKKMKQRLCDKKRENKNTLERHVTALTVDYLKDPKRVERIADDMVAHYEKRANGEGLKSIEVRIAKAKAEIEEMTTAFIEAKSGSIRASIEKRVADCEILLDDLQTQQAGLELELGFRITKRDITAFIMELINSSEDDKDFQRIVIDNLVNSVYFSDGNIVVYFNISGGGKIEHVSLDDTNGALNGLKGSNLITTAPPLGTAFELR